MKPVAEMVYFRRRGDLTEDCIPVLPGTAEQHVDPTLITRKVPLYEAWESERDRCRRLMDRILNDAWNTFSTEINPK